MKKFFKKTILSLCVVGAIVSIIICTLGGVIILSSPASAPTKNNNQVHKIGDSIVAVESPFGWGSGVVIGKDTKDDINFYYVLTAHHLLMSTPTPELEISNPEDFKFTVTSYNDNEEIIGVNPATYFAGDKTIDSLVIMFSSTRDIVVAIISTDYRIMDDVYSCT